jgi:hypothetical protein
MDLSYLQSTSSCGATNGSSDVRCCQGQATRNFQFPKQRKGEQEHSPGVQPPEAAAPLDDCQSGMEMLLPVMLTPSLWAIPSSQLL